MAKKALYQTNTRLCTEDNTQEQLIYAYTNVLNKLNKDNLQAALYFIYKSLINNSINIARFGELNKVSKHTELQDRHYDKNISDADVLDYRIQINTEIDRLIKKMKYVNKPSVVFLLHLQQYIQDNDYDVREFREYVCQRMNINKKEYSALLTKCQIEGTLLREPLLTVENKLLNDNYSK